MTIRTTLNLFLFLCLGTITSSAQFTHCAYVPTDRDLWDVYFIDEHTGIVVGDKGTILRSTDGGLIWTQVMSNDTIDFKKIKFFDDQTGIALGSHIFKTSDAGKTWAQVNLNNSVFFDIAMLNGSTCIVTGAPTGVLKSYDQGETWEVLATENGPYYNFEYGLLSFIDENTGYTISNENQYTDRFLKTTDGGISWDTIQLQPGDDWSTIAAFHFINEDEGFLGGWYAGLFKKTKNGGSYWETPSFEGSVSNPNIFDFHIGPEESSTYYACGWNNTIYKSTDSGDTWQWMEDGASEKKHYNAIFFLNEELGWIVGLNGTILKTAAIDPITSEPDISVFPNPATDNVVLLNKDCVTITELMLTDETGRFITRFPVSDTFSMQEFPAGIYFLTIKYDEGGTLLKKINKH